MEIITAYQTKNDCYKAAKKMTPAGIVVHSTGVDNPKLSRYVDYPDALGKPSSKNWNRTGVEKMVHGFIGLDKDGAVAVVNTLPYNYCCWGCGQGKKGSYNYSPAYIQFEICEDDLADPVYFAEVFDAAAEYCAYLCKTFGLSVANVVSHKEANKRGYASNHADVDHWLKRYDKTMEWFRELVTEKMNPKTDAVQYDSWYGRVNTSRLNRRSGPSTDYPSLGTLSKGDEVIIISEEPKDEYDSIWVQLDNGQGWVNKKYLDFVRLVEIVDVIEEEEIPAPTPAPEEVEPTPVPETEQNEQDKQDTEETAGLLMQIILLVIEFFKKIFKK